MSILSTITRRYLDSPQLITESSFQEIAELLDLTKGREALELYFKPLSKESRIKAKMSDPFYSGYRFRDDGEVEEEPEDYGVIKVDGPLTYKAELSMCAPDTCNYQDMVKQMEHYAQKGMKRVLMIHDSPGGEAFSLFDSANEIRAIADENDIELVGFVDGIACSASYGLLAICDKIYASSGSSVGSIGVVVSMIDNSEAMKMAGLKRVFITAGDNKVPFDDEGKFKDSFLEKMKGDVETLYDQFVSHVAKYRESMSEKDIRDTQAAVYRADEALKLGLIDKIMSVSDFKKEYLMPMSPEDDEEDEMPHDGERRHGNGEEDTPYSSSTHNTNKVQSMAEKPTIDMAAEFEAMKQELATLRKEKEMLAFNAKKQAISQSLSKATFLSNKDDVVTFLASSQEDVAAMLNSVINDAQLSIDAVNEEAANLVANAEAAKLEAEQAAVDAKAEADKVIAEFGTKQNSIDSETVLEHSQPHASSERTAQLHKAVQAKLANRK